MAGLVAMGAGSVVAGGWAGWVAGWVAVQALQAKALHLGVPPTAVEELANQLHDLLAQALDTARQSCATRTTTDRHYLRRQASKKLRQLDKLTCLYKVGRRRLHAQPDIWHCAQAVLAALQAEMEAELGPVENTAEGPARGHGGKGMLCNATAQDVEEAMRTLREQLLTPPTTTHPTPAGEPNAESAGHSQTAPATSMPTTPMSSVIKVKVKVKVGKSLHRLNFPVLTSSFRPLFDLPDAPSAVPPTSSEWVPI